MLERAGPFFMLISNEYEISTAHKTTMLKKTTHSYFVDNCGLSIKRLLYILVLS